MAPPPGRRAGRPVLRPGDLLAGRYRLEHPVEPAARADAADESPAVLWRAADEVLARPVAVKVLRVAGTRGEAATRPFLAAAATAASLTSPVLARVYDAAVEGDVAYVISEWVAGRDLAAVLREDGPLEPEQACAVVAEAAEALHDAHAHGIVHGRLHPGNALLLPDGGLVLTDGGTSAALPERAVPAERAGDPVGPAADVRDLTALLYAMVTGRWSGSATPQPSCGVPLAPVGSDGRSRGRLTSPRQVRAGVPRALDDLVVRVLQPTPTWPAPATAAALADALDAAVRADVPRAVAARPPRLPPWVRRRLPVLASALLLLVVGIASYAVGRQIGEVGDVGEVQPSNDRNTVLSSASPDPPTADPATQPIDLTTARVVDFDPPPGDGSERRVAVPNAFDDDPTTAWATERYDAAALGGLKSGVGLLVDLGRPTAVGGVELITSGAGTGVELRVADELGATAADFRVVAGGTANAPGLVLTPPGGTAARWWLVWVTSLREVDGGFSAAVAEMRFLRG